MSLVLEVKKHLPRPVRATLRPVYQKVRGVWNPAVVLDKELLRDTMEYFGLSEPEVIGIAKLRHKLNAMLWNALNPKSSRLAAWDARKVNLLSGRAP